MLVVAEAKEIKDKGEGNFIVELVRRWKCHNRHCSNYDHSCYVDSEQDNRHYVLSTDNIHSWNKCIRKGLSTIHKKPHDMILYKASDKSDKTRKADNHDTTISTPQRQLEQQQLPMNHDETVAAIKAAFSTAFTSQSQQA
jgi:hypothetical protein